MGQFQQSGLDIWSQPPPFPIYTGQLGLSSCTLGTLLASWPKEWASTQWNALGCFLWVVGAAVRCHPLKVVINRVSSGLPKFLAMQSSALRLRQSVGLPMAWVVKIPTFSFFRNEKHGFILVPNNVYGKWGRSTILSRRSLF